MEPTTLSFEDFWQWLLEHHNCIPERVNNFETLW